MSELELVVEIAVSCGSIQTALRKESLFLLYFESDSPLFATVVVLVLLPDDLGWCRAMREHQDKKLLSYSWRKPSRCRREWCVVRSQSVACVNRNDRVENKRHCPDPIFGGEWVVGLSVPGPSPAPVAQGVWSHRRELWACVAKLCHRRVFPVALFSTMYPCTNTDRNFFYVKAEPLDEAPVCVHGSSSWTVQTHVKNKKRIGAAPKLSISLYYLVPSWTWNLYNVDSHLIFSNYVVCTN